jgi:hypothetical protein
MQANQLQFITLLSGDKLQQDMAADTQRSQDRRGAFDQALSAFTDEKKAELREAMKVRAVDKSGKKHESSFSDKGQEEALDTFKATRKGRGLAAKDMQKVGGALKTISEAAQSILSAKTSDGKPLFDTQAEFELALTQELFTPLMREGVLPENFIINKYSEVQQLLDASFRSYKKRLTGERDDKEKKEADEAVKRSGAGDGILGSQRLEQVASKLKRLAATPDRVLNAAQEKVGMSNTTRRRLGVAKDVGSQIYSGGMAMLTLSKLAPGPDGRPQILSSSEVQLDPSKAAIFDEMQGGTQSMPADPDAARVMIAQAKMTSNIASLGLPAGLQDAILKTLFVRDETGWVATFDWTKGYGEQLKDLIKDVGVKGYDTHKLTEAINNVGHETANTAAAVTAARAIDGVLVAALDGVRAGMGSAVKGRYAASVDVINVGDAAGQAKPDDQAMIKEYALAFERVFAGDIDPSLAGQGKKVAAEFIGNAKGSALQTALRKTPATAFEPLVQVADAALDKVLKGLGPDEKKLLDAGSMKGALVKAAQQIDAALSDEVKAAIGTATPTAKDAGDAAAEALSGLYLRSVDIGAATQAALKSPADGAAVVAALAGAFQVAMARAAPDPSDKTFVDAGKAMARLLQAGADAGALGTDLAQGAAPALAPVVAAARKAIADGLKGAGGLVSSLQDPQTQRAIASKVFADGGEVAIEEMEKSDEDLKAYERQLVLIDEGGIAAAEMATIDKLIAQIERDRAIAEMIVTAADALTGLGITTTSIVGWTTEKVTDTLVGEIAGPLKAAKLIIQFGVAMKQANDRRILFNKIKRNLKRSKRAVSPLQSTIQGLFDNKVEQIAFDAVEQALVLVQIAAAILGSVPEPITLAVSKSMSAAATAAEAARKVSELIYNEVQLTRAWNTTKEAIRNPNDRATGLKALRLNPTLGMHAIAWAGMERQPPEPTARMLLNDLGLNEQTLMVSGTEDKVRQYLETLLNEDRSLLDADMLEPKWVPATVTLSIEDWAVCVTRASRDADPPLVATSETRVLDAMKKVVKHDLKGTLKQRAAAGAIEEETEMTRLLDEVVALRDALRDYTPMSSGGAEHEEMGNLAAKFLQLTSVHERELRKLSAENLAAQARDVQRVVKKLKAQAAAVDQAAGAESFAAVNAAFDAACDQIREVQMVSLDEDPAVKPDFDALMNKAQALGQTLAAMGSWADEDPDWSGDPAAEWEDANKAAGRKDPSGLAPLLKTAKDAAVNNVTGSPVVVTAMKAVIDNIDKQLAGQLDPGPAVYLRQLKSGAAYYLKAAA